MMKIIEVVPSAVRPADDRYPDGRISRAEVRQAMELIALIRDAAGPDAGH